MKLASNTNVRRLVPLVLGMAMLGAPAVHAQTFTMPPAVYSGVPFNVTVSSSQSLSSRPLQWQLNSCTCTVSPREVVYSGTSMTYQLTVTGTPDNNALLQLVYGSTLDHNNFQLLSATPQKLTVSTPPSSPTASSFNVTVTATDNSGVIATSFNGTVTVISTDPLHSSLGTVTLTNGTNSFATSLDTPGSQTITASAAGLSSGSSTIQIIAPPAIRFRIDAPATVAAGVGFAVTVTALNANGETAKGYSGTVTLTSTDPQLTALGSVTLTNGVGSLSSAILKTSGSQTLTGTDAAGLTGTSGSIAVVAGPAIALTVSAPDTNPAGTLFNVTVTVRDAFGNVSSYAPIVTLSSTDNQATGMGPKTLTSGTGSFATIHKTAGAQRITATGAGTPSISGFADVTITAASSTHFTVAAPPTATAGVPFSYTVTAKDSFDNLASAYLGTVRFSSTDPQAVLSADSNLSGGSGSFLATLKTAVTSTISATDISTSSISGVSGGIVVSAAAPSSFVFTPPTQNQPAGTAFRIFVTLVDTYGNTITSFTGPATITSSDPHAVLPSPPTLVLTNGIGATSVTLNTAGIQSVTVTGAGISSPTSISVQPTAATHFDVTGTPTTVTAGQPFVFTVTAKDAFGNTDTMYGGTLSFLSGDPSFVSPPGAPLLNGTGTFQATLKTAGNWTITANDTKDGAIGGTSAAINVTPTSFNHFVISPIPSIVTAGAPFTFTVTAKDEFDNTVTDYSGTAIVTSGDPQAGLPGPLTFTNGSATGQATFKTEGDITLTFRDAAASISQRTTITVFAGPPNEIQIVSGNSQQKAINTAFAPLVVRVVDTYQNPIRGWQVTFTPPSTGASISFTGSNTVRTGDDGQASISPTANQIAGSYNVQVTASDHPERLRASAAVSFSLTNLPGPPATLQLSGAPQPTQAGTQFAQPLVVTVKDASGNTLSGVGITFAAPPSGQSATLSPPGPYLTDSSGKVSVTATANASPGSYSVTASVAGTNLSGSFLLVNLEIPPGTLTVIGGTPLNSVVTTAFPAPLQVLIKDASGTPLSNTAVVFSAIPAANGASAGLSTDAVRTDAMGVASIIATANTITGSYQVQAVAATGGSGTFNLTNIPGAPAAIQVISGSPQSAQINLVFSDPLRVRVVDRQGNGISGAMVIYSAPDAGASASFASSTVTTDSQGYAQVSAASNITAGAYFVNATTAGISSPAVFSLQNVTGETPLLVTSGGTPQAVTAGTAFPQFLQVTIRDALGNPIPNVTVFLSAPLSGSSATLSAPSVVTDAQGKGSVRAVANNIAGTYTVEASAPGISAGTKASFALTNKPGAVTSIVPSAGATPQSAAVNRPFVNPLRLSIQDSFGNPIPGVTVTYSAPGTGASAILSSTTAITDATGVVSVSAVANSVAGTYAVSVSTDGGITSAFNLTNVAGAPATIEITSGDAQSSTVGGAFGPLIVTVRDALGNPVFGHPVTISVPGVGASAIPVFPTVLTDSSGQGVFRLNANMSAGSYQTAVSSEGVAAPAVFRLANTAVAAAHISLLGGGSQAAFTGATFAFPLRVLVQDMFGNPVNGATVTFTAPASQPTAQLSAVGVVTDPLGQASVSAIAGSGAGSYVVVASLTGISNENASFNLTNIATTTGTVVMVSGSAQTAPVGNPFIVALTAAVLDQRGNPIPGVTVTFAAPVSGPSAILSAKTAVTDTHGNVTVTAVANATAGSYQVLASADGYGGPAVFSLQNTVPAPSEPTITSIVNSASFLPGASPGSLQTIFGANLATTTEQASSSTLPITLGGVSVTIGGRLAPLLYVSPTQINFQVPPEMSVGRVEVIVTQSPALLAKTALDLTPSAPGIFLQLPSAPNRAAALNQDFTRNSPSNPATAGAYVLVFMTGVGAVSPALASGQPAPAAPLSRALLTVNSTIGLRPVTVQFAGKAPGLLGDQVNLLIPADLPTGDYAVSIRVDGVLSNSAVISVVGSGVPGGLGPH